MLFAQILGAVLISLSIFFQAPRISTSLAFFVLSWANLPLLSSPPLHLIDLQLAPASLLLLYPSNFSRYSSLESSYAFESQIQPVCPNRSQVVSGLISEASCSMHDEPTTSYLPWRYNLVCGLVQSASCPGWKSDKSFSSLNRFGDRKVWFFTSICCALLCVAFFWSRRVDVTNEAIAVKSDANLLNIIRDAAPFSTGDLSPVISSIVFRVPSEVSELTFENLSLREQDLRAAEDIFIPSTHLTSEFPPSLHFSSSSAAIALGTNLCHSTQHIDSASITSDTLRLSSDVCNDQDNPPLYPLQSLTLSIVAATSSIQSPASPELMPYHTSPPAYPQMTSPAASPSFSVLCPPGETIAISDVEEIPLQTDVNSPAENISLDKLECSGLELRFETNEISHCMVDPAINDVASVTSEDLNLRNQVLTPLVPDTDENGPDSHVNCIEVSNFNVADMDTQQGTPSTAVDRAPAVLEPLEGFGSTNDFDGSLKSSVVARMSNNISWADEVDMSFEQPTTHIADIAIEKARASSPSTATTSESPQTITSSLSSSPLAHTMTYTGVFHGCCALAADDFVPDSWDNYDWSPCWTSKSRFRPKDSDCSKKSTRFAVDNIDFMKCSGVRPHVKFSYQPLEKALASFGPCSVDCFNPRLDGTAHLTAFCFGIVTFNTVEQATKAFNYLQGRRLSKNETHWRLEFLDPNDGSYGGRKVVDKPAPSPRRRILAPGLGIGERRRPGSDLRAVLSATAAHNNARKTKV